MELVVRATTSVATIRIPVRMIFLFKVFGEVDSASFSRNICLGRFLMTFYRLIARWPSDLSQGPRRHSSIIEFFGRGVLYRLWPIIVNVVPIAHDMEKWKQY